MQKHVGLGWDGEAVRSWPCQSIEQTAGPGLAQIGPCGTVMNKNVSALKNPASCLFCLLKPERVDIRNWQKVKQEVAQ